MSLILPKGMKGVYAMQHGTSSGNPTSWKPDIKVYCRSKGEYCELASIQEHPVIQGSPLTERTLHCTHSFGPIGPLVRIKPLESNLDVCIGKMCPIQQQLTKEAYRELLAHEPDFNY